MNITEKDLIAAEALLEKVPMELIDAVRLAIDAMDECGGRRKSLRRVRLGIRLGAEALKKCEKTVTFETAVKACLEAKKHLRPRSLSDIKQMMNRLMRENEGMAEMQLRAINSEQCRKFLDKAFITTRQKFKAKAILSGVFATAERRGWCGGNPIRLLESPVIKEQEIHALSLKDVRRLLDVAGTAYDGACRAAVGLMLFAGIRPTEVERLTWGNLNLTENIISLRPRHTKTGGTRHVTILPVLKRWLDPCLKPAKKETDPICPKAWRKKWNDIRQSAGWEPKRSHKNKKKPLPRRKSLQLKAAAQNQPVSPTVSRIWQQDCLRHTYASYHAKHFKDYSVLQAEMGHGTLQLLRTRYLNMDGISSKDAESFWNMDFPPAAAH